MILSAICVCMWSHTCCGLVRFLHYTSLESAHSKVYKMHSYNVEKILNLHIIILHWQDSITALETHVQYLIIAYTIPRLVCSNHTLYSMTCVHLASSSACYSQMKQCFEVCKDSKHINFHANSYY